MNRHFLKCAFCERPMAVNAENSAEIKFILEQACPLCGELALRYMGRVEKTNLVRNGVRSACDLRCTNAIGPKCDCLCSNENHGTHRLVVFSKVVGKLEVVEKDLLNDNETYLARIKRMAAAKNNIKVKVITFLTYKYREVIAAYGVKSYLDGEEYWQYQAYKEMLQKIDKLEDLKSIQRKINTLTHLIPKIGNTLEYLEALSAKQEAEEPLREKDCFSTAFERDWKFYLDNRPIKGSRDKFDFCGEAVLWLADETKEILPAKEAFYTFDSTGARHPTNELDLLLSVLMFKRSLNFHIKMWVEGYEDCVQGVQVYMDELINPPDWVAEAFRNQLYKNLWTKSSKSSSVPTSTEQTRPRVMQILKAFICRLLAKLFWRE